MLPLLHFSKSTKKSVKKKGLQHLIWKPRKSAVPSRTPPLVDQFFGKFFKHRTQCVRRADISPKLVIGEFGGTLCISKGLALSALDIVEWAL